MFNSNRYSVPLGTFEPGRTVELKVQDSVLRLFDLNTRELMAEHQIHSGRGQLIQNTNHLRDVSQKLHQLQESVLQAMGRAPIRRIPRWHSHSKAPLRS
jgi:hypothetical protein